MNNKLVMILDSGIGGLSIAEHIHHTIPDAKLLYVADNAAFPYGNKSAEEIEQRISAVIQKTLEHYRPNIIVIACNTASTAVLSALRGRFNTPFVGVVPAIKPAAQITKTKYIGVLCTKATSESAYTQNLINTHASHCHVTLYGSNNLAGIAENKLKGTAIEADQIKAELKNLFSASEHAPIDTIVLACTHFPLLKTEMQQASNNINWVDSGAAIAKRVEHCLSEAQNSQHDTAQSTSNNVFMSTDPATTYSTNIVKQYIGEHATEWLKV